MLTLTNNYKKSNLFTFFLKVDIVEGVKDDSVSLWLNEHCGKQMTSLEDFFYFLLNK
jgi:hypothetical protein